MNARGSLLVTALCAACCTAVAQVTVLDTTFLLDSRSASWHSTGVDIQPGDYVYLFSFGAVIDWGASNGHQVQAYMVNSDNSRGQGEVLDSNSGVGAVFRVAGGVPAALPTFAHIMNPWSGDSGELQIGYNSNYYADNSGSLVVGVIRMRGAPSVLDTTFLLDSRSASWQSTGVDIQPGDYVYLFSFGAVIDWGASNGHQVQAYMVNSDNSWGHGEVLDSISGVGAVFRVAGGVPAALPTFAHIMNPWSGDSGELQIGYNSNYYADNSGSLVVGVIVEPNPFVPGLSGRSRPSAPSGRLQVLPCPTGTRARLSYSTTQPCRVTLKVFDLQGRAIRTLQDAWLDSGFHTTEWDGADDHGLRMPAGSYVCRLQVGQVESEQKVVKLQ